MARARAGQPSRHYDGDAWPAIADESGSTRDRRCGALYKISPEVAAAIVESMAQPVLLIGGSGELLGANRSARGLPGRGRLLRALADRLLAEDILVPASSDAPRKDDGDFDRWVILTDPEMPRQICAAARPDPGCVRGQSLLVAVSEYPPSLPPVAALRELFGFTAAEARVAAALVPAGNIKGVAASLAIAPETVRSHLKSVFRKTGLRSRQELTALLLTVPTWTEGTA